MLGFQKGKNALCTTYGDRRCRYWDVYRRHSFGQCANLQKWGLTAIGKRTNNIKDALNSILVCDKLIID